MGDVKALLEKLRKKYNDYLKDSKEGSVERKNWAEYINSGVINEIKENQILLENIEEAHLPCVTSVLCNISGYVEANPQYKNISIFYMPSDKDNTEKGIENALALSIQEFEKTILPYADEYIMTLLKEYIATRNKLLEDIEKRIDKSKKPAKKKNSSKEKKETDNCNLTADDKTEKNASGDDLKRLEEERGELQKEIERLRPYGECVEDYRKIYEADVKKRWQFCYSKISENREITVDEENQLIKDVLQNGLSKEQVDQILRQPKVLSMILDELKKDLDVSKSKKRVAYILESLEKYDELKEPLRDYIEYITDFLMDNDLNTFDDMKSNTLLWDIFNSAIAIEKKASRLLFPDIWGSIKSEDVWDYLIRTVSDNECLSKMVENLPAAYAIYFIKALNRQHVNLASFAAILMAQKNFNKDIVIKIITYEEEALKEINADLLNKDQELDKIPGKIVSEFYRPMEKLELLAYDFGHEMQEVNKDLLVGLLEDCALKFREGFEKFNILSAEEFTVWQAQKSVEYDRSKHRYESAEDIKKGKVNIKTLGFKFPVVGQIENCDEKIMYAKVESAKEN